MHAFKTSADVPYQIFFVYKACKLKIFFLLNDNKIEKFIFICLKIYKLKLILSFMR